MSTQTMDRTSDRIENRGRPDHLPGFTVAELVVTTATIAIIIGILYAVFADTLGGVNRTQASMQINGLIQEAKRYRSTFAQGGTYTDIDLEALGGTNDSIAGIDTDSGLNIYGLEVTVAAAGTGDVDATLTYATPSTDDCNELRSMFTSAVIATAGTAANSQTGIKGVPVCPASGILTLTLE